MTYYFDMDGVLADFHSTYTERAQALSHDYLANLAPFVENVKTVRNLIAAGSLVYILTKAANEDARQGKLDWLAPVGQGRPRGPAPLLPRRGGGPLKSRPFLLPLGEKWKMLKKFTKMAILAVFETSKNWVLKSGQNRYFWSLFRDVTIL